MTLSLRPETADDEAFLRRLFAADAAPLLAASGLATHQVEALVDMQFRAQRQAYDARFPEAERSIVILDEEAAGRLMVERTATHAYVVHVAIAPERRRQGLGSKLIGSLMHQVRDLRAETLVTNTASLALFSSLGFEAVHTRADGQVELAWSADGQASIRRASLAP